MNQATQTLMHEHEAITLGLKILARMEERVSAEEITDLQDLSAIARFLKDFVDTCHHGKEEGILFPALQAQDPARTQAVLQRMLADRMLSSEKQSNLAMAFEVYEDKVMGPGQHDALHATLKRLLTRYPA